MRDTVPRASALSTPLAGLLALAILLGILVRFVGLDEALFWHDEVATRIFAAGYTPDEWRGALYTAEIFELSEVLEYQSRNPDRSLWTTVAGLATDDPQHPPLYYALIRAWSGLFGNSIAALRTASALVSVLMLPCLFWFGWELFGTRRAAWTGVALGATSPFFMLYGQEAREYALWTLLLVLSSAALLRAVRLTSGGRPPIRAWALYALCTIVSLYTSFSTVAVLGAQAGFILWVQRGRVTAVTLSFAAAAGAACLAFLPWALALVRHFDAFEASMRWSKEIVIPNSSLLRIQAFNASRTLVDFWPELESPAAWAVTLLAVGLIGVALLHLARRAPERASVLLLFLVAVPLALTLLPDLLFGGIRSVSARYMTPSWVAVSLAVAYLASSARGGERFRVGLLATVLVLGLASCWSNTTKEAVWTKGTSIGLPAIARLINTSEAPLVVSDFEIHHPGNMMALSTLLRPSTRLQFLTHDLRSVYVLPDHPGDIFLVSPIPPFRDALEADANRVSRLLYEDIYLQLWKLEPAE